MKELLMNHIIKHFEPLGCIELGAFKENGIFAEIELKLIRNGFIENYIVFADSSAVGSTQINKIKMDCDDLPLFM